MALASDALLTLEEALEFLDVSEPSKYPEVEDAIEAATDWIEGELQRKQLKTGAISNELHSGGGTSWLWLREWPVTAVSKVEFLVGLDTWEDQSRTYLVIDALEQAVHFRDRVFPKATLNVRVSYTAGYAALPAKLKQAAKELTLEVWRQAERQTSGIASTSFAGQTVVYTDQPMPKATVSKLATFRRESM